LQRAQEQRE
jgi:hypothetical protein